MTVEHRESWGVALGCGCLEVTRAGITPPGLHGLLDREDALRFYRELGEAMRAAGLLEKEIPRKWKGLVISASGERTIAEFREELDKYKWCDCDKQALSDLDETAAKLDREDREEKHRLLSENIFFWGSETNWVY